MVIRQELVPLPGPHPTHLPVPDMHLMDSHAWNRKSILSVQLRSWSLLVLLDNSILPE